MNYVAGWNMPGCLPECEPAVFDTFESAREYIETELDNVARNEAEPSEIPTRTECQANRVIRELDPNYDGSWFHASDSDVFESTDVGGYVYWIHPSGT